MASGVIDGGDASAREFVDYLRETLIPDLQESGYLATAADFRTCAAIITRLLDEKHSTGKV